MFLKAVICVEKQLYENYFLAANSLSGFVSYMKENYSPFLWRTYLIKGGPGTGKSTFMRKTAQALNERGIKPTYCYCSSDPSSLDGIIFEDEKIIMLDATAPHTLEPEYLGVCEQIINLGEFLDSDKLKNNKNEIISVFELNRSFHKTAKVYLKICGKLKVKDLYMANEFTKENEVLKFADSLSKKLITNKSKNGSASIKNRFIDGITPNGKVAFQNTVTDHCENVTVIKDSIGNIADLIVKYVKRKALDNGYSVINLKSAFLPQNYDFGIIIPELSTAVVCENAHIKFDSAKRKINIKRFYDKDILAFRKSRLSLNEKIEENLLSGAYNALRRAKAVHDKIEKYYIDAMDFNGLDKKQKEITQEILKYIKM